jgi:SOS-response transcriptional repressor LexA
MKTIDQIRRQNLASLTDQAGGVGALAKIVGKSDSQISQWLNASANSGTGKPRGMRSSSCRELERAFNKPLGWMEQDHGATYNFDSNVLIVDGGVTKVPLVNYVQAGILREIDDGPWSGDDAEFLVTDLALSKSAFALQIKGDSMLPDFREGDRVIIDPEISPQPGDFVVAKNCGDEATFKKYRPRGINHDGTEIFELVPLNSDYPSLRSDVVKLIVIGTMVEHRKYRKR